MPALNADIFERQGPCPVVEELAAAKVIGTVLVPQRLVLVNGQVSRSSESKHCTACTICEASDLHGHCEDHAVDLFADTRGIDGVPPHPHFFTLELGIHCLCCSPCLACRSCCLVCHRYCRLHIVQRDLVMCGGGLVGGMGLASAAWRSNLRQAT